VAREETYARRVQLSSCFLAFVFKPAMSNACGEYRKRRSRRSQRAEGNRDELARRLDFPSAVDERDKNATREGGETARSNHARKARESATWRDPAYRSPTPQCVRREGARPDESAR